MASSEAAKVTCPKCGAKSKGRPEIATQERGPVMGIGQLRKQVKANKADEAKTVCTILQNVIKDHTNRLNALK